MLNLLITEVLSSDEDEIDDAAQDYLEALDRKIKSKASPFEIKSEVVDVSYKLAWLLNIG